jgi:hypothetical protein
MTIVWRRRDQRKLVFLIIKIRGQSYLHDPSQTTSRSFKTFFKFLKTKLRDQLIDHKHEVALDVYYLYFRPSN